MGIQEGLLTGWMKKKNKPAKNAKEANDKNKNEQVNLFFVIYLIKC